MEAQVTQARVWEVVLAVLVGFWIIGVTWLTQGVTWALDQLALIAGLTLPPWTWPLAVWINAVVAGAPAVVVLLVSKAPTVRLATLTWSLTALALAVIGSVRAIPITQNEIYLVVMALVTTAFTIVVVSWRIASKGSLRAYYRNLLDGTPGSAPPYTQWFWLYGLAGGVAMFLPWLWVGALGGLVESALAAIAAAGTGVLGAALLTPRFASVYGDGVGGRVVGGLVGIVAFTVLGAAVGASGQQLLAMVTLPFPGFVAAALCRSRLAIAALAGVTVLGPLAFVEPSQATIIVGLHDVGYWALIGAGCSLGIGLVIAVLSVIATALSRRGRPGAYRARRAWAPAMAALSLAAAAVVYPLAGHPGFHGERLFVVMKTQADLSGLAQIANLPERRAEVYERLVSTADSTQSALRAKLRASGLKFTPYYLVNGIEVDAGPEARIWLSRRADVDRVLISPQLRPIPSPGGPMRGNLPAPTAASPQWNITMIHADQVWAGGHNGKGIVIGSSDSGVDGTHPAIRDAFRGGVDSWYDPMGGSRTPVDYNGHGTHTIGSALGANGIGVAPGAKWMGCVNLSRNLGNPPNYLDCLQFMLAPFGPGGNPFNADPDRGADVLTNSWGCPELEGCDARSLRPAIDALTAAGLFVVVAAGNEGPWCGSIDDPPAPYPDSFTVGAVDRDGQVTGFSSRGPAAGGVKPDVVAPGAGIVSAVPGGGYRSLDGTSMATPQVAGVVALMWSAAPALRGNIAETARILRQTATPALPSGDCALDDQQGAGLIDANAAVYEATQYAP
jgi:hypothetical protein